MAVGVIVGAPDKKAPSGGRRKYVHVASGAAPCRASPRKGPFCQTLFGATSRMRSQTFATVITANKLQAIAFVSTLFA
jgi:hypothetical protein